MNTTALMFATFNRLHCTQKMMASLDENTHSPYRIIIIDNGSNDGTPEFLKTYKPTNVNCKSYEFYLNSFNKGIGFARSQGLKLSNKYQDPFLATLDNDVHLHPNWLKHCTDIITANPEFMIGVNYEWDYPLETHNGFTFQVKPAGNLGTATMVFPRRVFEKIGYFNYADLPQVAYGEEDALHGARARHAGFKMGYIQERGIHFSDGDTKEYREFKDKCHADNLMEFKNLCAQYSRGQKDIYVPFEWEAVSTQCQF